MSTVLTNSCKRRNLFLTAWCLCLNPGLIINVNINTKGEHHILAPPLVATYRMSSSLSVYQGTKRKLILSFDVGTTYSGISYRYVLERLQHVTGASLILWDNSILCPGELPEIKTVTRLVHNAHTRPCYVVNVTPQVSCPRRAQGQDPDCNLL